MRKKNHWILVFMAVLVVGILKNIPKIVTVSNNVNGRELPIYSVETEKKQVALTFDAAWGDTYTEQILEILKKHHVQATFFMTGEWAAKYPEAVKRIQGFGHDLGNHSENHQTMSQLSEEECKEEILSVHRRVQELTGMQMKLFRAPYGDYDDHVILSAKACGYETIQWSVDSLDWRDYGADTIVKTVLEHQELKNGAIILMHNGAKYTVDALETVIQGLMEKGYELVPVSRLLYLEPYHLDVSGRQWRDSCIQKL